MILYCAVFIVYFLAALYFNTKTTFFINSGLSGKSINFLFTFKIIAGLAYIYIDTHYFHPSDIFGFFKDSLDETNLLLHHPLQFIKSIFQSNNNWNWDGLFSTHSSYWNDLRNVFLSKILGIFNLLSFKNLYINSLLFNYFIFYGHIALYRSFSTVWQNKTIAKLIGCFFIPSSMYYLSGINKDSLFFLGAALIAFVLSKKSFLTNKKINWGLIVLIFVGIVITFIERNFFFVALIPAIISYYLSNAIKSKPIYIYVAVYSLFAIAFLSSPALMQIACNRQADFLQLNWAKSAIPVTILEPNYKSFITHFVSAVNIAFCRPYIWNSYSIFYFASAIEIIFLMGIIIISFFNIVKNKINIFNSPFILFCVFFGVTALLFIGYTIPILGAVTRYRTAFWPLLITPFLCALPLKKFDNTSL